MTIERLEPYTFLLEKRNQLLSLFFNKNLYGFINNINKLTDIYIGTHPQT